jgi:osmoprotectant transport system permease protein
MEGISNFIDFVTSRMDAITEATVEHLGYVVSVFVVGTIIAVSIGIVVRNRPFAREVSLGIASVMLTIPSLGLFVMLIPIVGIGFWPPFIGLTIYSLLPIMRNTVAGLNSVDRAVLESARGMGLSGRQRLWKIELPMAWPVMITGVRISVLLISGIAAIATLVGGGGLGRFINTGLGRLGLPGSMESVWTGTLLIIIIALAIDSLFLLIRRATTSPGLR